MLLCENCKYDIVSDPFDRCIVCAKPSSIGICKSCHSYYDRAWCAGERTAALEHLIDAYKFERVKDADVILASLLDSTIPELPTSVIVTHVPTVHSHIRRRGYDHAASLAKRFAARRNLTHKAVIDRIDHSEQRGKNKKERLKQASCSYVCKEELNPDVTYLLVDDIITTNASVQFAAKSLKDAGAHSVWVATLARQSLDRIT